ncbi:hypothetical protein RF11_09750 [Thelohanellus kitauei]|uniref:Uncharacterized protein n=1 Tax=Thelohanellus kitauei TaxID=669202 RepID=A0A0C2MIN4_THEKT|nr:hypothetical protein RF11_09750 [Thelohanellus kitauei]
MVEYNNALVKTQELRDQINTLNQRMRIKWTLLNSTYLVIRTVGKMIKQNEKDLRIAKSRNNTTKMVVFQTKMDFHSLIVRVCVQHAKNLRGVMRQDQNVISKLKTEMMGHFKKSQQIFRDLNPG